VQKLLAFRHVAFLVGEVVGMLKIFQSLRIRVVCGPRFLTPSAEVAAPTVVMVERDALAV